MKIAITGYKGNLGSRLYEKLSSEYEVTGIGRNEWCELNKYLSGVDVVLHAAGDLHVDARVSPSSFVKSNILITQELIEEARKLGVKRVIYISSCAVYGAATDTDESVDVVPVSLNGSAKYLNEKLLAAYCSANDMKLEILRVFNIYGGNDRYSVISKLLNAALYGASFIVNNGGIARRDFIHVDDVSEIVCRLVSVKNPHKIINIGSGVAVKISDIVDAVSRHKLVRNIEHQMVPEIEYSKANVERLRSLVDYRCRSVFEYIEERLKD